MAVGIHKAGINVQSLGVHRFFAFSGQAAANGGDFSVPNENIALIRRFMDGVVNHRMLNQHRASSSCISFCSSYHNCSE